MTLLCTTKHCVSHKVHHLLLNKNKCIEVLPCDLKLHWKTLSYRMLLFKFQILIDHLKLEDALLIADLYNHLQHPFTRKMAALNQQM